ncbi:MAG: peptidase [Alphaproteobacteria bacterium]|nr:peptidase [Alphaproteobacteria bacterium]
MTVGVSGISDRVRSRGLGSFVLVLILCLAAGCGGGGSAAPAPVTPPPVSGPIWTQGVYQPASTFKDFCSVVRTGSDSQGRPFPDKAGSLAQELFWLRSWTNETYLWNTEVADQNPASFTDRVAYFNVLKTSATAASGKAKDRFHFTLSTADYLAQVTSAPEASYGAEIKVFANSPPRDVRVLYTAASTPATELVGGRPKLARGARILTVDGVDVVNGGATQAEIDILNRGLFPRTAGEAHTFTVLYADQTQRTVTLQSALLVEEPLNRQTVLTTPTGKVGYLLFNTFSPYSSEKALVDAMASLKAEGVNDVVLDLRYNGGGLLAVASQLSYMIAGPTRTAGRIFERLQFNAAAGTTNPVTGGANNPTPFYSTGLGFSVTNGAAIQSLSLPRVFILSTASTCSASESVINGLRGIDVEVVLIGGTTCGKPYGFYPADNCGQTYFSIQFNGVNQKGFGDYPDGFAPANASSAFVTKIPGCSVADDLSRDLGDPAEAMLAAALGYRTTGSCPVAPPAGQAPARTVDTGTPIEVSGRSAAAQILRTMRDLRLPTQTPGGS